MDKVIILLSTYNGSGFLREQLNSLLSQKNVDIEILVRDDGSTDDTCAILDEYTNSGKLIWYRGNNLGPAFSFFDLMKKAPKSDYYAFCDQDDVWKTYKLTIAVNSLKKNLHIPALYCSNYDVVDADLRNLGQSSKICNNSLAAALFHNSVTGCTAVINYELLELVRSKTPTYIEMHDWWIFLICTAFKGFIYFDKESYILYRQHGNNVVGNKTSKLKLIRRRLDILINNQKGVRYKLAESLYNSYGKDLPLDNKEFLLCCLASRKSFFKALKFANHCFIKNIKNIVEYKKVVNKVLTLILLGRF